MMAYDRPDHPRDERFRDDRERGGRAPQGSSDNRGFFERAGDEISRWFGDEDAERRHEQDDRSGDFSRRDPGRGERGTFFGGERDGFGGRADRNQDRAARAARWDREQDHGRHDYREQGSSTNPRFDYRPFAGDYGRRSGEGYGRGEPRGSSPATNAAATGAALASSAIHHDPHYQEWRQRQIDQLDRDYEDYRREHQSKFDDDFSGWRSQRQSRRQTLGQVREHMEVVGSDDQLIGKVDKVQGDKIILTKESMGGFHKSLGCAAIDRIEGDRVILSQSADETHRTLQEQRAFDERIPAERRGPAATDRHQEQTQGDGPHILERSFSGTYPDEPRR